MHFWITHSGFTQYESIMPFDTKFVGWVLK